MRTIATCLKLTTGKKFYITAKGTHTVRGMQIIATRDHGRFVQVISTVVVESAGQDDLTLPAQ